MANTLKTPERVFHFFPRQPTRSFYDKKIPLWFLFRSTFIINSAPSIIIIINHYFSSPASQIQRHRNNSHQHLNDRQKIEKCLQETWLRSQQDEEQKARLINVGAASQLLKAIYWLFLPDTSAHLHIFCLRKRVTLIGASLATWRQKAYFAHVLKKPLTTSVRNRTWNHNLKSQADCPLRHLRQRTTL